MRPKTKVRRETVSGEVSEGISDHVFLNYEVLFGLFVFGKCCLYRVLIWIYRYMMG